MIDREVGCTGWQRMNRRRWIAGSSGMALGWTAIAEALAREAESKNDRTPANRSSFSGCKEVQANSRPSIRIPIPRSVAIQGRSPLRFPMYRYPTFFR